MAKQQSAPKKEAPKKAAKIKKIEGVWNGNFYIRGYGHVKEGEDVTPEAVALLKDASKYVS